MHSKRQCIEFIEFTGPAVAIKLLQSLSMSAFACEMCGDLVRVTGEVRRKRIYCSELCRTTSTRAGRRASLLERACAQCGASMSGRTDQKYCSAACRITARRDDPSTSEHVESETERDRGIANDLKLYIHQIGNSRLTAQLSSDAKETVIEALEDAARSLRRQLTL
jgi:hypothetical protein